MWAGSQIPLQAENYLDSDTFEENNAGLGSLEDREKLLWMYLL